ncbi:hypothetical protein GN956_G17014 [Arapaima gigas]
MLVASQAPRVSQHFDCSCQHPPDGRFIPPNGTSPHCPEQPMSFGSGGASSVQGTIRTLDTKATVPSSPPVKVPCPISNHEVLPDRCPRRRAGPGTSQ